MPCSKFALAAKSAIALVAAGILCGAAPARTPIDGEWENPGHSVKVRTGACGEELCGWVSWASDKAISDARKGGTQQLIGTAILRNYKARGAGRWQGEVFVPDMGSTFYSTLSQIDNDQIKVSGCILHGLICKSQLWHRV